MKSHSTNVVSDAKTAQAVQTSLLSNDSLPPLRSSNTLPLWLSTTVYFLFALTFSSAVFFLIWSLIHDESDDPEIAWIPVGAAISTMILAVAAREVVLRRARTRYLLLHDQFGFSIPPRAKIKSEKKFTLEQNSAALRLIERKAAEANLTLAPAEKHLEVFKASQEYLELVENELQKIQSGSPRLAALRKGKKLVASLHEHHLLKWTEEETRRFTREASALIVTNEKITTANRALEVLDFALKFYPNATQLITSKSAVNEFIISIRIKHWIELAEREAFKTHYLRAVDHYQDALFYLSREPSVNAEHDIIKANLEERIVHLNAVISREKATRKKLAPKKQPKRSKNQH